MMQPLTSKTVLGLYADQSVTSVCVSLFETDGLDILSEPVSLTRPYSADLKENLLRLNDSDDLSDANLLKELDKRVTEEHLSIIQELLAQTQRQIPHIDVIGYSGHTVYQGISDKRAVILGNGDTLAQVLQIPVIDRFIQSDLQAGGTGSPLLTTFWDALFRKREKPLAVIGLGGITTLTCIGRLGEVSAFDVGVGCLLLDKWVQKHLGIEMDFDGTWGAKGRVDTRLLSYLLKIPYLQKVPPKAVDRNQFNFLLDHIEGCSPADGAATLTAFIADSIVQSMPFSPDKPAEIILTGGGIHNPTLLLSLKQKLGKSVQTVKDLHLDTYHLESAGYGFLAVRSLMGLPISFPTTTGVPEPLSGGTYHKPD